LLMLLATKLINPKIREALSTKPAVQGGFLVFCVLATCTLIIFLATSKLKAEMGFAIGNKVWLLNLFFCLLIPAICGVRAVQRLRQSNLN
jgi:hypothetical protein